jgi:hypothetical protein
MPCCATNCVPLEWTDWSDCSVSCGSGTRSRYLTNFYPETCGGSPCNTVETEMCYPGACPTNCQVSSWSGWTCSASCGPGTESRSRYITVPEANGGSCPEASSLSETRGCDAGCCPSNCNVGGWSTWSGCSAGCGPGNRSRSRSIVPASCGGSCSETETSQSEYCDAGCCAVNCVIGGWSMWSGCSVGCGGGSQSRSRSITPASCGGSCSESETSQNQNCNTGCCPQHCQVNNWSQWSACSVTCGGGGTRSRNRAITVVDACGGNECPSDLSESEGCGGACCAANCALNAWSPWSACSVTCGSGMRSRSRTKKTVESCGGTCDVLNESEVCTANGGCCPVDCVWSAFGAWSGCSVTCGMGTQTRSRMLQSTQSCGGSCPGNAMESQPCMQPVCPQPPVDCEVTTWAQWSSCTATCGASATKSRMRSITKAAAHGGVPCPSLVDSANCGFGCCPVSCIVSTWSSWTACSATCGSGTHTRSRTATTDAACGGTPCPTLSDSATCSTAACATDCQLSMWSNWSTCSQTCGTGEQRRTRSVVVPPANGGAACGALTESQNCTQPACACAVSDWSTWTPCTTTCGAGMTSRSRNVTMAASDCPALSDSKACNPGVCPRDCAVGAWATWSACSATCGGGRRERTRFVTQMPAGNGAACPLDLTQSEQCNTDACTPPGLACSEYTACTDCTDNGKTSPRFCQFCMGATSGTCQSLHLIEGNATSGLNACPVGFNSRATTISACPVPTTIGATVSGATAAPTTTTAPEVIETVDISSALKLAKHETTPMADVTLNNGVRLQVRVAGEEGAMLRALEDGEGLGVFSPSRDGANAANATNMNGRLRAGLSMVFLFAKDRPVSFRRLVLGAWDDQTDSAQLEIGNDEFAADTTTTVATTTTTTTTTTTAAPATATDVSASGSTSTNKKRQETVGAVVLIRQAESSFESETAAGFTKYVLSASGNSDFSVKSFEFVIRAPPSLAPSGSIPVVPDDPRAISPDAATGEFVFDITTIALIAVAGALCLLIVIVVIVVITKRRKSRAPADAPSSSMSGVVPAPADHYRELRPALVGPESSLANTLARSDTYQSLSAAGSASSQQQQYQDLQVERRDSYQPLPADAGGKPLVPAAFSGAYVSSGTATMSLGAVDTYQPMMLTPVNSGRYDSARQSSGAPPSFAPPPVPPPRGAYGDMNIFT